MAFINLYVSDRLPAMALRTTVQMFGCFRYIDNYVYVSLSAEYKI